MFNQKQDDYKEASKKRGQAFLDQVSAELDDEAPRGFEVISYTATTHPIRSDTQEALAMILDRPIEPNNPDEVSDESDTPTDPQALPASKTPTKPESEHEAKANLEANYEAAVCRLAACSDIRYQTVRHAEAKALRVSVRFLDQSVKAEKMKNHPPIALQDRPLFEEVLMWDHPVNGETLLDTIYITIKTYIVCDEETLIAATLWIVFTWFIEVVGIAPIANISAPEKRCGKTQLLDVIGRISKRPLIASNISAAAMYRTIEKYQPTLLIDEADAFMKDNEELRGVMNSGHTRTSAFVIRTEGDNYEPRRYSTWGAKAVAGIGSLSDTLKDRSIVLKLRRKLPSETVKKLRHAETEQFQTIASMLARFAEDHKTTIEVARPHIPQELNDRAGDNWEPLLAIADVAGEKWGVAARKAAIHLSEESDDDTGESLSVELLKDIREVFETTGEEKIATAEMIKQLCEDKAKRWASYNKGSEIVQRQLSNRLKMFGIVSKTVHLGAKTRLKGYHRSDFTDTFKRYLPKAGSKEEQ